jgi:3-phenylpropionate/trans-cinnamate dioxygenase ferredoxin component
VEIDDDALEAAREELNSQGSTQMRRAFVFACEQFEIPPNGRRAKVIDIEGQSIALLNAGDEVLAFSNICPHEDSPVLGAGFFNAESCTVACPLHGWMYDMRSGKRLDGPGSIPVFEVRLDGEAVYVALDLPDHEG